MEEKVYEYAISSFLNKDSIKNTRIQNPKNTNVTLSNKVD